MDANPNSSNFFGDRLAELISKTIKKQLAQSDKSSVLQPKLEQMVEQQQQTNTQLSHLVKYASQLNDRLQENTQQVQKAATFPFWKKMALEVPPVVLAVLLAFGINSWWQQRAEKQIAAEIKQDIIEEVEHNAYLLSVNIENGEERTVNLTNRIREVKEGVADNLSGPRVGGIDLRPLSSTAWETAHYTDALRHMDKEMVQLLSTAYNIQTSYMADGKTFDQTRLMVDWQKEENLIPAARTNIEYIRGAKEVGTVLMNLYQQILEKYSEQPSSIQSQP